MLESTTEDYSIRSICWPEAKHQQHAYFWLSLCYAYVQNKGKLDARGEKGIFVGYDKGSPANLVYFPDTGEVKRIRCVKFTNSCDVVDPEVESADGDTDDYELPIRKSDDPVEEAVFVKTDPVS